MRIRARAADRDRSDGASMLPLIDIVFLLLIFFLVSFEPVDVQAVLDARMPSASVDPTPGGLPVLHIAVTPDAFLVNHRPIDLQDMERALSRLAAIDPGQTVLVVSSADAPHARLVEVLDMCAKLGLQQIALASGPPRG